MIESSGLTANRVTAPKPTRRAAVVALLIGAGGIAILWASGVPFPVAVPPGIVILCAAAALVGLVRRWWSPVIAVLVGLFVLVGFLASPTGMDNLTGASGAWVAIGQGVEVVGVLLAVVAGALLALRRR